MRGFWAWLAVWAMACAGCASSAELTGKVFACKTTAECAAPHVCVAGFCQNPLPDTAADSGFEAAGADSAPPDTAAADVGDASSEIAADVAEQVAETASDALDAQVSDVADVLAAEVLADAADSGPEATSQDADAAAETVAADQTDGQGDAPAADAEVAAEAKNCKATDECNGIDDDCDGLTDEDVKYLGLAIGATCEAAGICGAGVVECESPKKARCSTAPGGSASPATEETCNGKDDNCDGDTDEGFELAVKGGKLAIGAACKGPGACGTGKVECTANGKGAQCSSALNGSGYKGKAELCNGLDDDCNGLTDESFAYKGLGVGDNCVGIGACGAGVVQCQSEATATCSTNPGGSDDASKTETCNNKDDDCDGLTDEVCVDADGDGFCAGKVAVTAACKVCQKSGDCDDSAASANPDAKEQCNGADDDCDGATDNPAGQSGTLAQSCYEGATATAGVGICKAGQQTCGDGKWGKCSGQLLPGSETCANKADDDCDGKTDEGCPVELKGGSYSMGCTVQPMTQCASDTAPPFPYPVENFQIDPLEVSVAEYAECVTAKACATPTAGAGCNWGDPVKLDHPINCVTWQQASNYCAWKHPSGGALPTEQEWQAAAIGSYCVPLGTPPNQGDCPPKSATVYPFGSNIAACAMANFDDGNGCGNATKPADSNKFGPLGLGNMAGNVAEWTSSWFGSYPYMPNNAPQSGTSRVVMGGSYLSKSTEIYVWSRQPVDPNSSEPTMGFRCRSK